MADDMPHGHTVNVALLQQRLSDLKEMTDAMNRTLRGEGREPGLVQLVDENAKAIQQLERSLDSLRQTLRRATWLVVGTLVTVLGSIADRLLR